MLNFIKKNKKLWAPSILIIMCVVLMMVLSKFGFNPLGYVVY